MRRWLVLVVFCFAVGALIQTAAAHYPTSTHYHVYYVAHGMVHGSSQTDNNWHARVEAGAGTNARQCEAWEGNFGPDDDLVGYSIVYGTTGTCNFWVAPGTFGGEGAGFAMSYAAANGTVLVTRHPHPIFR